MARFKLKNPFNKFLFNYFLGSIVSLIKPLNISSIIEFGDSAIISGLKKAKIGKNYEKVNENDLQTLKLKQNSFDLVIISNFLNKSDSRKLYKEAQKISSKYILISQNTNPFNFFQKNKKILKIIKTRGIKIISKKILPAGIIYIVKKQGNRA